MQPNATRIEPLEALNALANSSAKYASMDDTELLAIYCATKDQQAVEEIVRRYSPLVAGLCRSLIADRQLAEDAYQAVFLILLRRAPSIRNRASLGAWLHGVAYRTATRLRRIKSQLATRAQPMEKDPVHEDDPLEQIARMLNLESLTKELQSLPKRLRDPVIEHYFLGLSMPTVADRMELSVSAIEGRIRRARRILRDRLAKKGVGLSVLLTAVTLTQRHAMATEAVVWQSRLLSQLDSSSIPHPTHLDQSAFSQLIQSEAAMFPSASTKFALGSLVAVGLLSAITPFTGLAQLGVSSGKTQGEITVTSGGGPAAMQGLSLEGGFALGTSSAGGDALAGGDAFSGGAGLSSGGSDPFGGGTGVGQRPSLSANTVGNSDAGWQPPTDGGLPSWLGNGSEQLRKIESNREQLNSRKPLSLDFANIPISSVLQELSAESNLGFHIDEQALDDIGITLDEPVDAKLRVESLREALQVILPDELTYVVRESYIEITNVDDDDARSALRYYDLSYVLPNMSNGKTLIDLIQSHVDDEWDQSNISLIGSLMVVRCLEESHVEIEQILARIAQVNRANLMQETPAIRADSSTGNGGGGFGGGFGGGGAAGMF